MDKKKSTSNNLYLWVSPPNTPIPLVKSPIRFAVGTPEGISSNSWRAWVQGMDIYVSCRDNFRQFKVSLHASGMWRVAFTEQAIKSSPNLRTADGDRVIHRRKVDLKDKTKAVTGFQVVILNSGLYLSPAQRKKWPNSVVFTEPPLNNKEMTVLSVVVAPTNGNLVIPNEVRGSVIGKLPLGTDQTVQLVVTHESDATMKLLIRESYKMTLSDQPADLPEEAVFLVHGNKSDDTPWFSAIRVLDIKNINE